MANGNGQRELGLGFGRVTPHALYEQFEHFVFHFCSFSRLVSRPLLFFLCFLVVTTYLFILIKTTRAAVFLFSFTKPTWRQAT